MDEKYRVNEAIDVQLEDRAHSNRLFAIKFSHNESDIFYTGGWDRYVCLLCVLTTSFSLFNNLF